MHKKRDFLCEGLVFTYCLKSAIIKTGNKLGHALKLVHVKNGMSSNMRETTEEALYVKSPTYYDLFAVKQKLESVEA